MCKSNENKDKLVLEYRYTIYANCTKQSDCKTKIQSICGSTEQVKVC